MLPEFEIGSGPTGMIAGRRPECVGYNSLGHGYFLRSYEGALRDVLAIQSQLAVAIAGEIHVTLTAPDQARASRNRQVDLGAYDAYLKGRHEYLKTFTKEAQQKAIGWFHHALELDPSYAPAYAGLADCYYGLSNIYDPPTEVMPKARWAR